mgnify:CR=1 FL=1
MNDQSLSAHTCLHGYRFFLSQKGRPAPGLVRSTTGLTTTGALFFCLCLLFVLIANAEADLSAQANPDADTAALLERYPKAVTGDFDGDPAALTEMDALIAYLQMLGTLVDFSKYDETSGYR